MKKLSLQTQTLYAELLEQLLTQEAHRSMATNPGGFTKKTIKGETYYYFQYSEVGAKHRQIYLGKKSPALEKIEKQFDDGKISQKADLERIQILSAQLRSGGALTTDFVSARVLKALADSGFFHSEAVLIGTHAFLVLGNALGIKWEGFSTRTQDIDLASEPTQVAIDPHSVDIPSTLKRLEMGFIPVPTFNHKHPSTSFHIRGQEVRLDLLTPLKGGSTGKPILLPQFQAAAQPLRFLDYLIESPIKAVLLNGESFLVNIPDPARFAFHKLIVAQERDISRQSKADKDLNQAGQLLLFLSEERKGDLALAWKELKKRGKNWEKRVRDSLKKLYKTFPILEESLNQIIRK